MASSFEVVARNLFTAFLVVLPAYLFDKRLVAACLVLFSADL